MNCRVPNALLYSLRCRRNAFLGPSQGSRQAEQLGTVAFSRLRVQPPLRPRLHLSVHLAVIPATRGQLA